MCPQDATDLEFTPIGHGRRWSRRRVSSETPKHLILCFVGE
jgi:hypothetical protein